MRISMPVLALSLICLGLPLMADNSGQQEVPFVGSIVNPCNGEVVDYSGTVHVASTLTVNNNNFTMTFQANPQGVTGKGETTGATYQFTGVTRDGVHGSLVNGSANETFVNRFDANATGSTPNFAIHETANVTVNADGTVTVFFDNASTTCH